MANKKFSGIVDKPLACFFAEVDEEAKMKENLVSLF